MSQTVAIELKRPGIPVVSSDTYASIAEDLMNRYMKQYEGLRAFERLTTTKLRSIYSLIMNNYVKINSQADYEQHKADIQYLKVRMAYEAGREGSVKKFLNQTYLMELVDSIESFEQFRLYCRYAEALVAYFKYFGGRDS